MNSQELMNYKYDSYTFNGKWHELIGDPGKRFHMMVFGRPKQGKSIFCVQFANYFSQNFGPVLYVAAEEGFSVTLQKKIREFGMANNNMDFANYRNYEQIRAALQAKPYKLVFIDSVNFIKITPEQIEELKAQNPQTAFVTVQQATKGGQFRGSQEYAHNCDIIIEVIAGIAHQQGRYQVHSEMPIFEGPEQKQGEKPAEMAEVSEMSPEYGQMELF
jgi:predicted ATP-dependent serine protease